MTRNDPISYWEDPKRVAEFAARPPDHRLVALVERTARPEAMRVLDLGCAGGRNARYLAERGIPVVAADAAPAMVAETRRGLAPLLGEAEAAQRVYVARMDDLSFAENAAFDLVLALGIYHMAESESELACALAETARVLAPGGSVLIATFAPGTRLGERIYARVAGTCYVHETPGGERGCLLTAGELDRETASLGLVPLTPTETVRREARGSVRVVTNAHAGWCPDGKAAHISR